MEKKPEFILSCVAIALSLVALGFSLYNAGFTAASREYQQIISETCE